MITFRGRKSPARRRAPRRRRGARPPATLGKIDPQSGLQALTGTLQYMTGPVAGLKPNPLAGTGVDPLDNGVGPQLADFQPLASSP